jgi:hypothetical protein
MTVYIVTLIGPGPDDILGVFKTAIAARRYVAEMIENDPGYELRAPNLWAYPSEGMTLTINDYGVRE